MNNTDTSGQLTAVLLYHRVGWPRIGSTVAGQYVAPCLLRSQLKTLKNRGWQSVGLAEALAFADAQGPNRFAVTFDDGYLSVFDKALPILADTKVSATVYIVCGHIGGINKWDSDKGDVVEEMMSSEQIRQMHEAGFEIGSHTMSHARLTTLSPAGLKTEVADSKKLLEDLLGSEVSSFSCPYGDFDPRVRDAIIQAGYRNAVITTLGTYSRSTDIYAVPRVNVRWNHCGAALVRKILRGECIASATSGT